jgi:hypothetical protein
LARGQLAINGAPTGWCFFRCHCGCDYCGIVSCDVAADEKFIRWRDIRGEEWPASTRMVDLTFDRSQYVDAIEDFARQTFPTSDIVCAALTLIRKKTNRNE